MILKNQETVKIDETPVSLDTFLTHKELDSLLDIVPNLINEYSIFLEENKSEYNGARKILAKSFQGGSPASDNNMIIKIDGPQQIDEINDEISMIYDHEGVKKLSDKYGGISLKELNRRAREFVDKYQNLEKYKEEVLPRLLNKLKSIAEYKTPQTVTSEPKTE